MDLARVLDVEAQYKASQSAGNAAGGGFLVGGDMALDIIELLRPVSVMRQLNPVFVNIPRGTKTTPRIDVGVSSGYVAEGAEIPTREMSFGDVTMSAKKLATLVVLTNELLTFSRDRDAFSAERVILDDMLASIGQVEDEKFLFGTGSSAEPLGLVNAVDAANKFNANATVNVANVVADLGKAISVLRQANIKFRRPAWIFSGRTEVFLQTLLDANGHFVFRREIEQGKLLRWPFYATENIPNNLGAGNESVVILVDASEVMLGDVSLVQIDRSNSATLMIDGVNTSLFATDRSAVRVRTWNDVVMRHATGAAVIEGVTWGG